MRIRVLGAAAGGGFPQWNCGCPNCRDLRAGDPGLKPLTQECVAVSPDGERWFLLNASPDIRWQIEAFAPLQPRGPRHSPIAAFVLTNGDLDHCLGLLLLRESYPLVVYATEEVRAGFVEENVLYRTLERFPGQVTWRELTPGLELELHGRDGETGGLSVEAVPAPGKPPIHLEGLTGSAPGENVGLLIRDRGSNRCVAYFSSLGAVTPAVRAALDRADCVFLDGTFWSSEELIALGLGDKRAEAMAHLPVGGRGGSPAALAGLRAPRRILIHINNTNPALRATSAERAAIAAAGWELAHDGMELSL
jgi:pyrroloquinoline quinone biosynthesis protein B